ncbi:MAG: TIGR01777 family oxidoreductase [Proteobacteria bacterium]|nr:TIGR01777 family oxidoreductase [Pseudomonadota bacterium]
MRILITGGTGFIGKMLCSSFKAKGYDVCVLTRNARKAKLCLPLKDIHFIENLKDIKSDEHIDVVVNLAGATIAKRWTTAYKKTIINSRKDLTQALIEKLSTLKHKPALFINGSAIGYYGPQGDDVLSEDSPSVQSFSHELCATWEQEALKAKTLGMRLCLLRTGVVLGEGGGVLAQMRLPFLMGVGGPIGNGKQWMSWIHMVDMVRLVHFCIEHPELEGPLNATSPNPVTNQVFAQTLAKTLHRPAFCKMPAWVMRLLYGQMAHELLLTGQRVVPTKLTQHGFSFIYPSLEMALLAICR